MKRGPRPSRWARIGFPLMRRFSSPDPLIDPDPWNFRIAGLVADEPAQKTAAEKKRFLRCKNSRRDLKSGKAS